MAFLRRRDVGQAFRNNTQLQEFMLTDVTPTGRMLGTGSYGSVEEVLYKHLACAAKKLHETLIEAGNDGVSQVVHKYLQECQLMASLRHPNVTLFLGLCFLPDTRLPLLVMERLESSLDDLLEHMPGLPLSLKRSVLEDVASGLVYLHDRQPPVIHRDLTAKNVLLTSSLLAKITDMGNSRIVSMRPGQMARTLSQLPGTLVYMPPEALDDTHRYGASLDVFSFGHLALYTLIQKFPGNLLSSTFLNPDNLHDIRARTELERRVEYIELLEEVYSRCNPNLVTLVKECLHNGPEHRPATDEVLTRLQRMRVEVEGKYGASLSKLDITRVRLMKDLKMKDEELTQQEERHEAELEEVRRELQERTRELERESERIRELQGVLEVRDRNIQELLAQVQQKNRELATKDGQVQNLQREIEAKDGLLLQAKEEMESQVREELQSKEAEMSRLREELRRCQEQQGVREELQSKEAEISRLREELRRYQEQQGVREELQSKDAETSRLREELRRCQEQEGARQMPQPPPLRLKWRRGPDMPFKMGDYIQSVLVQGKVYVGGGDAGWYGNKKNYIVMEYDTTSRKWDNLPPYKTRRFAMTVINNQLVLVGGVHGNRSRSKVLGVWSDDSKEWTHPYPEMPTARSHCSAIVYNEWLVVAGGYDDGMVLSCVEVMNTESQQWLIGASIPEPQRAMKTAIAGDTCYFMGGDTKALFTNEVYSVFLPGLISQLNSRDKHKQVIWRRIPELKYALFATPLYMNGSLLMFGGMKNDRIRDYNFLTDIHLYQPDTGEWVKVGDLPSPWCDCTCVMINNRELLVTGGYKMIHNFTDKVYIAAIM